MSKTQKCDDCGTILVYAMSGYGDSAGWSCLKCRPKDVPFRFELTIQKIRAMAEVFKSMADELDETLDVTTRVVHCINTLVQAKHELTECIERANDEAIAAGYIVVTPDGFRARGGSNAK